MDHPLYVAHALVLLATPQKSELMLFVCAHGLAFSDFWKRIMQYDANLRWVAPSFPAHASGQRGNEGNQTGHAMFRRPLVLGIQAKGLARPCQGFLPDLELQPDDQASHSIAVGNRSQKLARKLMRNSLLASTCMRVREVATAIEPPPIPECPRCH